MQQNRIRRYLKHGMLPQLSVFEAVTRHGSYTRAAEELCLAQPTVSVQIKKLTESVGLPLLEQAGRHTRLTPAGHALHAACRDIFKTLEDLEEALAGIRGLESGVLRIAAGTACKHLAPRLLSAFAKSHPGIEVSLHVGHRRALLDRLAADADDLYIFADAPEDAGVVVERFAPNPLAAFARADHPLAGERRIAFARFAQEPFLMRETGSGTRTLVERVFAQHGVKPRTRMELGGDEAIREAMLAGLGVSILYRQALGFELDARLTTLDVEGLPQESYWHFVHPAGRVPSLAAKAFMDFVREQEAETRTDSPKMTRARHEPGLTVVP